MTLPFPSPATTRGETRSIREYLETSAKATAVLQVAVALVITLVATSRAENHTLSPLALAVLVASVAATLAGVGWPQGVYAGAADVLAGNVAFHPESLPGPRWSPDNAAAAAKRQYGPIEGRDGFAAGPLWRATVRWAALAALWSLAGAGLVAVVLDGRHAGWIVVSVSTAGLGVTSSVVVDALARRHGIAAARQLLSAGAPPMRLRRRAWREVALPLAVLQGSVNAAVTWVLFHSYRGGGSHVLTSKVALADAIVSIVILGALATVLCTTWGAVDARLGRVVVDAPGDQQASATNLFGWQAVVYVGVLGLVLAKLGQAVLPKVPNLIQVGAARAVLTALMTLCAAGLGYVRGALNQMGAR